MAYGERYNPLYLANGGYRWPNQCFEVPGLLSTLGVLAPAQADWTLSDSSRIGFVSIKNNSIGENNAFDAFT